MCVFFKCEPPGQRTIKVLCKLLYNWLCETTFVEKVYKLFYYRNNNLTIFQRHYCKNKYQQDLAVVQKRQLKETVGLIMAAQKWALRTSAIKAIAEKQ